MALILIIDCSGSDAFVCIAENGLSIAVKYNAVQKDHAAFLHKAIQELCSEINIKLTEIQAVSVADGPGSYTGLRVAMSTAKGLCFALKIPLLCFHNFHSLALETAKKIKEKDALYIPLIDARRLEVFTTTYDYEMNEINSGKAEVLTETVFNEALKTQEVYFAGDGCDKAKALIRHKNAHFVEVITTNEAAAEISNKLFVNKQYEDLKYATPYYIKAFYKG